MTKKIFAFFVLTILIVLNNLAELSAQKSNLSFQFKHRLHSPILNENRNISIHLPANYYFSDEPFTVLYRLDGDEKILRKTLSAIQKLSQKEENIPKMIVVTIENTNRSRDMWPVNTKYYTKTPGAKNFLAFIELKLIPYMEKNYKTSQQRILCGQSLSGIFTLYSFLINPELFDSYLVLSGAFPDCEEYFKELSYKAFQQRKKYHGQKIFISHGLKDPLEHNGQIHKQMTDFYSSVKNNLQNNVSIKYLPYKNGRHIPKNSLYDGMKFIFNSSEEQ